MENINEGTSLYNIGGASIFRGNIKKSDLIDCIRNFVNKNNNIRIRLRKVGNEIMQYVYDYQEYSPNFMDFSKSESPYDEFEAWLKNESATAFSLLDAPLFTFNVICLGPDEWGYTAKIHHIISDGWSMKLLSEVILKLIQDKQLGEELKLSYLDYKEYVDKEKEYLNSSRFQRDKKFWAEKLSDLSGVEMYASKNDTRAERKTYVINRAEAIKISDFIKSNTITNMSFYTSVLFTCLSKIKQMEDCIIGTPILNRSGIKEKSTFGMFASTVPVRMNVQGDMTFRQLMAGVNKELHHCMKHQRYPYDILIEDLNVRQKGNMQLFQHCINYRNTDLPENCGDIKVENIEFFSGHLVYSFQLVVKDWYQDGSIHLDFEYRKSDYSSTQIDSIMKIITYLIEQVLSNCDIEIQELQLMKPEKQNEIIYEWNNTRNEKIAVENIVALFEKQVLLTPEKTAIECNDIIWSYHELSSKSNVLANKLMDRGIRSEDVVAIYATHSLETILSIWAILKAGAAFLPIDPQTPVDRMKLILEDSGAKLFLSDQRSLDVYPCETILINADSISSDQNHVCLNSRNKIAMNHLAYLIYTSGSTGRPKGVMIEHEGLANYACWASETYIDEGEEESFPLFTSLSFDLTLTSIFVPLIKGSKIIIYPSSNNEFVLERIIKENRASIIKLTPSHMKMLLNFNCEGSIIKRFIVGGEDLKTKLAKEINDKFTKPIEIYNEYGPTETVVGCTFYKYRRECDNEGSLSIGNPIHNAIVYVLDRNLRPVPVETTGEIYISGVGVARGYLHQEELTNECFIPNPFVQGARLYKTGDLGMYDSNGQLYYAGRIGQQFKINGYRIEPMEIENSLLGIEGVRDVFITKYTLINEVERMVAYIIRDESAFTTNLKKILAEKLPTYMIPSDFIDVERFPITVNGKIDAGSLPSPVELGNDDMRSSLPNKIEQDILHVFSEVLGKTDISLTDNFFFLGGDSIKAIQAVSKLERKSLHVKVKDVLLYPTAKELALVISETTQDECHNLQPEGEIMNSPIFNWFFNKELKNPHYYLQSLVLDMKKQYQFDAFKSAVNEMVRIHDTLRIGIDAKSNCCYYSDVEINHAIHYFDLSNTSLTETNEKLREIDLKLKKSIQMDKPPLFRFGYVKTREGDKVLLIAHHLLVDGVSWRIILDDFRDFLAEEAEHSSKTYPKRRGSYQAWAKSIVGHLGSSWLESQKSYWKSISSTVEYNLIQLKDITNFSQHSGVSIQKETYRLSSVITKNLLTTANIPYRTKANELIATALILSLHEILGSNQISFLMEGHGREMLHDEIDITRTVGWFTSIYPVSIEISENELNKQLIQIRDHIRSIPHNGLAYGILTLDKDESYLDESRMVRLNYLGELDSGFEENDYFELSMEKLNPDIDPMNQLTCLLSVDIFIFKNELYFEISHDKGLITENIVKRFADELYRKLETVVSHCLTAQTAPFSPNDFSEISMSSEDIDILFT